MSKSRFSCHLIGADSLLVECGEALLRGEHEILGVITPTPRIAEWARSRGLPAVDATGDFGAHLGDRPFDYLFAITHLSILPEAVLRLPRKLAINFHDGPLPDYAGLNAPAWALMQGESRYGITWHVMRPEVDAGEILKQKLFDVAPDETAFSLNTKCFEAAIDSFSELVLELAEEKLDPRPQDPAGRRYFERHRRPAAAGAIDWSRSAEEIEALVRALDFGRYPNPLGLPKVHRADRILAVTRAQAQNGAPTSPPGTVLAINEERVLVATGQGSISLQGFADLRGRTVAPAEVGRRLDLHPGSAFDRLDPERTNRLTELDRRMSRAERFWVRRLSQLDPITLPFPRVEREPGSSPRPVEIRFSVPEELRRHWPGRELADVITSAFCAFLARIAHRRSFDIGAVDPALRREIAGLESWVAARIPLHVEVQTEEPLGPLLDRVAAEVAELRRRGPWLRDTIARHPELHGLGEGGEGQMLPVCVDRSESSGAPSLEEGDEWTLGILGGAGACRFVYDAGRISAVHAESLQRGFSALLASLAARPELPISRHPVVDDRERERQIVVWNRTAVPHRREVCVHELFGEQVHRTPGATAVVCEDRSLTYAELNARADLLAAELRSLGVLPGEMVGVCVERSLDLVVSILGILKAGAAYLPLDPDFPSERLAFMIEDSRLTVIVAQAATAESLSAHSATGDLAPAQRTKIVTKIVRIDADWPRIAAREPELAPVAARPSDLAYVIYTSGSTGKPKGVLVEHRNVASFFAAIDERVPHDTPGAWLAVTSLSFDISVLELLWTLTRGFKVVLHTDRARTSARTPGSVRGGSTVSSRKIEFSLFYFSSDEGHERGEGYRLLLEGAKFADENGFVAVWTPERHFHAFGGLYPNPAVTGAAIAAITRRVEIRAGSVVLPLHHPIRVAEDWALIDNLSGGRVGISFASGWQPNDFVLAPQNHKDAKEILFRNVEIVRRLWRGEAVAFPGPNGAPVEVQTLPRPVQPALPVWITSAGNIDTYSAAGRIGANVLTHLLGQSVEQLAPKIEAYREARAQAGLDPATGVVSLMLHTFVGDDEDRVREKVHEPLERYLGSSLNLLKDHAWAFPAFRRPGDVAGDKGDDLARLDAEERAVLLAHARERYYDSSGLFGTPERCLELVERLQAIGVDEIACLIDFGVPAADVLASLPALARVRQKAQERSLERSTPEESSLSTQIRRQGVTHLQCTPSMARMLCSDPEARSALREVKHVFIGGEAFPGDLARELSSAVGGTVTNMYGPTETTIWSSTHEAAPTQGTVPIGRPIANSRLYVLDEGGEPLPIGAPGELYIGGDGVARGYFRRPELDAERFLADPFADVPGARMYRTGDVVRYRADGVLEFLGRTDHQIKVRGHRIEPGEIESALASEPAVGEAVVLAREDTPGDQRLVAYVVARGRAPDPAQLRERLKGKLPEYMVPAHFVFLERMPRTPNGKTDRRALPPPEAAAARPRAQVDPPELPSNDLEVRLAKLWQETLGVERVGIEDNFFDLGGHSLLVVRIHRRMAELTQKPVSLTDLFRFPTVRSLARFLASEAPQSAGAQTAFDQASLRGRRRRESMQRRGQRMGES